VFRVLCFVFCASWGQAAGFGLPGSRVQSAQGSRCRAQGSGFRVQGSGFMV
jgi:hypothetical protein